MSAPRLQAPSDGQGRHLVLYDGVCGLCSRLRRFLDRHDPGRLFEFASLQSETGRTVVSRAGGDPNDLSSFYVVVNHRSPDAAMLAKSRAVLFVTAQLGWPWKAAGVLRVLPTASLDFGYDVVARYRYRIFGVDACALERSDEDRHSGRIGTDRNDSGSRLPR